MSAVAEWHRTRMGRATDAVGASRVGALLVTPSADLVYLTGYDPSPLERLTCLVLRPGRDPVLVVPALEEPLARQALADEVVDIVTWRETEDPHAAVARLVGKVRAVGCSDRMWAFHVLQLQRAFGRVPFIPASRVLGPLRAVKDQRELDLLKRAARYADAAFSGVFRERLETRTEREVARRLEELMVEMGHDSVAFTIVASGPNGASPHHDPSDREIKAGDGVVLDFGGRTEGYCSDVARTVAVQRQPDELDHVHEVVQEAQEAAFRAVAPGVPAADVDRAARAVIERSGYGELFLHRTGHGIGLEEHEPPWIVAGNPEPLREGMCFSIEPGIYLPDRFGVRIEDIVTVTTDGAERLNRASRELEVVR
jgi:Xaa-Pro aminopeptidase